MKIYIKLILELLNQLKKYLLPIFELISITFFYHFLEEYSKKWPSEYSYDKIYSYILYIHLIFIFFTVLKIKDKWFFLIQFIVAIIFLFLLVTNNQLKFLIINQKN